MNAVFSRRSIRKYTEKPVTDDHLHKILEAGMCAPSAGNERPWHFILIRNRDTLAALSEVSPFARMIKESAAAVVVCAHLSLEKHKGFWVQDCSAATENMLIEIQDLGLGAVWLGVHPRPERERFVRELLGLPQNVVPFSIIPVGHPGETKPDEERFDPSRVHEGKW